MNNDNTWQSLRSMMDEYCVDEESRLRNWLDMVEDFFNAVCTIVGRTVSYDSDRPQDYVTVRLVARAYRLGVSSIRLALSGYPDSAVCLQRSIFEIGARLLAIPDHAGEASYGYLIHDAHEQAGAIEAELHFRRNHGAYEGNLASNLATMQAHLVNLRSIASKRGFDPDLLQKQYGKNFSIRSVLKRYDFEKAYSVDFTFMSGYVHSRDFTVQDFSFDDLGENVFVLGPLTSDAAGSIADTLKYLSQVIIYACFVLEDPTLISLRNKVHDLYAQNVKQMEQSEPRFGSST